jgi:hypothetical protein
MWFGAGLFLCATVTLPHFIMATPFEKECEKYHVFRSPFATSCVCRAPKYLFSSGGCEGCLKAER